MRFLDVKAGYDGQGSSLHGLGLEDATHRKQSAALMCLEVLNGDWREPVLQHYCRGCCRTREETCKKVYATIIGLGLLTTSSSNDPVPHRWMTCTESFAEQNVGKVVHANLPRTVARAFADSKPFKGSSGDQQDDFHKYLRSKVWRSKLTLNVPAGCIT